MPAEKEKKTENRRQDKKVIKLGKIQREPTAAGKALSSDDIIFSLDIGTRTIVGIAGFQEGEKFKVLAAESIEHRNRAMLDGQIHDIDQVAQLANEVKKRIEKVIGFELRKVAIAAAGRVLRTVEVKLEKEIEPGREIDQKIISSLEIEGIQKAQEILDREVPEEERSLYYCVGYSIINYYLNGYIISKLLGHKGKRIAADILATFLPHSVVDSLYTVINKIGLEVGSLTLEPIAAINATIPKDLRLLNLALVDIGAGTSDIAITRDGSVVAYAMAPVAGDEITEAIAQHFLVDFNTAEKIKLSLSASNSQFQFNDILGMKKSATSDEILECIAPATEYLAETIAQKIIEYNQKAPNAVFLIGGGSQVPGLPEKIALHLQLPIERVAVRKRDIIKNIKFGSKKLSGPEAVTPIGIAMTAVTQQGNDFLYVSVNGRKIRLFNTKKLTVADALILIGFNPSQLIGRTGKSIGFSLNGENRLVRGEHGKPAEISINGKPSSLDTVLNPGDEITVKPAVDGKNASLVLKDVIGLEPKRIITIDGKSRDISLKAYINGNEASWGSNINDGDMVTLQRPYSLGEIAAKFLPGADIADIKVNGLSAAADHILENGDIVELAPKRKEYVPVQNNLESDLAGANEKSNGRYVIVNGKTVALGDKSKYIFVDIFNFIDFDITKPKGSIVLRLNGNPAAFTDEISAGDIIDIHWEK